MNVPNQSSGVRRTVVAATFDWGVAAAQFDGREPEPDGLPEETTSCGPCSANGFQECTTFLFGEPIDTFTRECTRCGPCQFVVPVLVPGQPAPPGALLFTQRCVTGGNVTNPTCTRCSPESRIDLPWPASDRCIQICCGGLDPTTCSVNVRTC